MDKGRLFPDHNPHGMDREDPLLILNGLSRWPVHLRSENCLMGVFNEMNQCGPLA